MDETTAGERLTATVLARSSAPDAPPAGERRTYRYLLRVEPAGRAAFEADVEHAFWPLELKPAAGDAGVRLRAGADGALAFDLAGDPRYDADALIAATAARRRALL